MKVSGQDVVTVELAVSKKSCFVRDPKVLPLMELIVTMPTEQRRGKVMELLGKV